VSLGSATPAALNSAGLAKITNAFCPVDTAYSLPSTLPASRSPAVNPDTSRPSSADISASAPRPAYLDRYLPSMLITSGSSFAAIWVASRSQ